MRDFDSSRPWMHFRCVSDSSASAMDQLPAERASLVLMSDQTHELLSRRALDIFVWLRQSHRSSGQREEYRAPDHDNTHNLRCIKGEDNKTQRRGPNPFQQPEDLYRLPGASAWSPSQKHGIPSDASIKFVSSELKKDKSMGLLWGASETLTEWQMENGRNKPA